ncbi:MAG: cyanase [Cellvibrionaceae bacterium]
MNKETMTDVIFTTKAEKNITWEKMGNDLSISPVWLASACLGMNSATAEQAKAIADYLGLGEEIVSALVVYPTKVWDQAVPTDPLVYRLYEIVGVYGDTLKEVIQEKFGDGIMSAIDFSMDVEKEENPKGDRVVVTMNGKFLPYASW